MSTAHIKTATRAAITAVGGVHAAATVVRVGVSQLSEYQNRQSASVVPVDVAVDLDRCADEPLILAAMALAEGYALLPLHVGEGSIPHSMEDVSAKAGATLTTAIRAMADGQVDTNEAREIARDLEALIRVATHALHVTRAHAKNTAEV